MECPETLMLLLPIALPIADDCGVRRIPLGLVIGVAEVALGRPILLLLLLLLLWIEEEEEDEPEGSPAGNNVDASSFLLPVLPSWS